MRPIKYRAFLKNNKFIVDVVSICFDRYIIWDDGRHTREIEPSPMYEVEGIDDVILMQDTGLLDKNGKRIHEGDIITVINKNDFKMWGDSNKPFEVVWDGCCYSFNDGKTLFHFLEKDGYETTVIGNKFENPELINQCA